MKTKAASCKMDANKKDTLPSCTIEILQLMKTTKTKSHKNNKSYLDFESHLAEWPTKTSGCRMCCESTKFF